jgi:hypothetical protein
MMKPERLSRARLILSQLNTIDALKLLLALAETSKPRMSAYTNRSFRVDEDLEAC